MNDILFTLVHQVIAQVNIPFIIAGDFNEPVQKLPIYQEFKKIGVVEAFEFYQQNFGGQLPATCRGSTRHDTAIIHHSLVPMIKGMHVREEHLLIPIRRCSLILICWWKKSIHLVGISRSPGLHSILKRNSLMKTT